jgi:hypothetical protein
VHKKLDEDRDLQRPHDRDLPLQQSEVGFESGEVDLDFRPGSRDVGFGRDIGPQCRIQRLGGGFSGLGGKSTLVAQVLSQFEYVDDRHPLVISAFARDLLPDSAELTSKNWASRGGVPRPRPALTAAAARSPKAVT